jgi:predicted nucleic acid-binding protein
LTLYIDSSAILKLYLDEPETGDCESIVASDPDWQSARLSRVEVRRILSRSLRGREYSTARRRFDGDWARTQIVELDRVTCDLAAQIAESTGIRTLDSLHLAAAQRVADKDLRFLTYDRRQARAARGLGFDVVGT